MGSLDWGDKWICKERGRDTFFCGGPEVDGFGKMVHCFCWWWRWWGRARATNGELVSEEGAWCGYHPGSLTESCEMHGPYSASTVKMIML